MDKNENDKNNATTLKKYNHEHNIYKPLIICHTIPKEYEENMNNIYKLFRKQVNSITSTIQLISNKNAKIQ